MILSRIIGSRLSESASVATQCTLKPLARPSVKPSQLMAQHHQARTFYSRIGLGIESPDAVDFFLKHRLSTAWDGTLARMANFPQKYQAEKKAFTAAFEKARGVKFCDESERHFANKSLGKPWHLLRQANPAVLRSDQPYVNYYRQAVEVGFARGGEVCFYLGGHFDVKYYAEDIINAEIRTGQSFTNFADIASYEELVPVFPPFEAMRLIRPAPSERLGVSVTGVELYDLTTGSFRHFGERVQYHAHDGARLHTPEFLARHADLLRAAMTRENRDRVACDEPMTNSAREAINLCQRYINGSGAVPVRGLAGAWRLDQAEGGTQQGGPPGRSTIVSSRGFAGADE